MGCSLLCLSVDVETWAAFTYPCKETVVSKNSADRLHKLTFLKPLHNILQAFETHDAVSTFFVSGEIASLSPEVVREIYDSGHEVASHGYRHAILTQLNKHDFEKMERMNKSLLTRITGSSPIGFRAPVFSINTQVLDSLERMGYEYDSSVVPSIKIPGWFGVPDAPIHPYYPSKHNISEESELRNLCEVPIAVFPFFRLPAGGGWFLRNMGVDYVKAAIKFLLRRRYPVVLYIHLQDLSLVKPEVAEAPFHLLRNCGRYSLMAIENILQTIEAKKVPISEIVSTWDI